MKKVKVPWQEEPLEVGDSAQQIIHHLCMPPGENPMWIQRSYPITQEPGGQLSVDSLKSLILAQGPDWPAFKEPHSKI